MDAGDLTALHDMALFVEVGKTLSFRKASQNLGIPAATLSRRITALEAELGVALFHRSTRVVTLTEIGLQQIERCEHLVNQARHVLREFTEAAKQTTGHLRISMPVDLGVRFIGPLIPAFTELYPNITFDLDLAAGNKNIFADGIDIAIRIESQSNSDSKGITIGAIEMGLYASPAYLNVNAKPTMPAKLTNHTCVLAQGKSLSEVWRLRSIKNSAVDEIKVTGNCRCNNLGLVSFFAEQGLGIAKLAKVIADQSVNDGRLEQLLPQWEVAPLDIKFITPTDVNSASVRVFRDYLSNKLPPN